MLFFLYPAIHLHIDMGSNEKSHTRVRLVPKSMTLDDLERPQCVPKK